MCIRDSSNVAAFLPAEQAETPWGIFLRGLDFFELWSCGLVGYGLAAVAGGRSRLPYALAFGGHAVFTLLSLIHI